MELSDLYVNYYTILVFGVVSICTFIVLNRFRKEKLLRMKLVKKQKELKLNRAAMHTILEEKKESYPESEMIKIRSLPGVELAKRMRNSEATVQKVLTSFQARCKHIESTNFLGEYIEKAERQADALDAMTVDSKQQYPMFGLPISFKECIAVKGKDQTCGLVKYTLQPALEDSVIFQVLTHCKAVPFITTSMARAGMSHDSSNPVFGDQVHPKYSAFSAGGSSGGEGIALSLDASVIGVGTDIGGSVRFPPAFNGVCGINPTRNRISSKGIRIPGGIPRIDLAITVGPMARYVSDLALFFEAVLCEKHFELDHTVIPKPFNMKKYSSNQPMKIGFYTSFDHPNLAQSLPCVKRGVLKAVDILREKGHTVEEIALPKAYDWFCLALKALLHDGGQSLVSTLDCEPLPFPMKLNCFLLMFPRLLKQILVPYSQSKLGKYYDPVREAAPGLIDSIEAANLMRQIQYAREDFTLVMRNYDAIVCPLFPVPVPKKADNDGYYNLSAAYSIIFNLLNNPAGVVCVDKVNGADVKETQKLSKECESSGDTFHSHLYGVQNQAGMPLCAQVVSKPFNEETVLRVMKIIEDNVDFDYHD